MQLSIRHTTSYAYDPAANHAALRLMLHPPQTHAQTASAWEVTVNGKPVEPLFRDALGNAVALWHQHSKTRDVAVVANGFVETSDTTGVLGGVFEAARPALFLRTSELTAPDDSIRDLAAEAVGDDLLGRLHLLSAAIHKAIDYRPGATSAKTTAAEATATGAGVCQDHAHVFISACRHLDIPARYVVGYLFDVDDELNAGDQTHAWSEAYVAGLGWVGFDVTNQLCPTDAYVRVCAGLDASDAAPVRGVLGGQPEESFDAEVQVVAGPVQFQSQS
ncbi:MAG: transglutaminase family protein [Pseudomonadota bacterium]